LAQDLIANKFSLKHLIRTIVKKPDVSAQRCPERVQPAGQAQLRRYYPRRMTAEVLFDAVSQVTDSPTTFAGLRRRHSPKRAIMLPGRVVHVVLPRCVRGSAALSACECERVTDANLAQRCTC